MYTGTPQTNKHKHTYIYIYAYTREGERGKEGKVTRSDQGNARNIHKTVEKYMKVHEHV